MPTRFTLLLDAAGRGDDSAAEALLALAYDELHRLAARLLAREGSNLSIQTTMMVSDVWMNLMGQADASTAFENRRHFFGAAAKAMRRILVDHARERRAARRGGDRLRLTLKDQVASATDSDEAPLLELHDALAAFEQVAPTVAPIVELRYFAGLTLEEVAESTGRSLATVKREWSYARAWLHEWMKRERESQ